MDKAIKLLAGLMSVLLLVVGLRWLVDPAGAAGGLGMPLLEGMGRSTQIGDTAAFFLVAGGFGLFGLIQRNPTALLATTALVGGAALGRLVAWQVHGAPFAAQMIIAELVMVAVFSVARARLNRSD